MLPIKDTMAISYSQRGYTGTIPTEFGRMSEMASGFYLYSNKISSSIPTQLGQTLASTSLRTHSAVTYPQSWPAS